MPQFTITLTDEQVKALETDMLSIQEWIDNAINVKANKVTNRLIIKHTDKNPDKLDQATKDQLIRDMKVAKAMGRAAKSMGKTKTISNHRG